MEKKDLQKEALKPIIQRKIRNYKNWKWNQAVEDRVQAVAKLT
jgi:hypothetical protein